MPSGITAAIYEGKDVTLEQFLQRVARSFSLAILQREDDPDAPLKRDEGDTKWHDEKIAEAEATLLDLAALTLQEAGERADADHEKELTRWNQDRAKVLALRSRYEDMIRQVEAWEPEPLVAYLKDGALKYLRESLEFDCGEPGKEMAYRKYPHHMSAAGWLEAETAKARRDIDYHRKEIAAVRKRAAQRNEHIDAFYRSLKADKERGHCAE